MSSSEPGTRVVSSAFLDPSVHVHNVAVIILNWRLPAVTPRLLEKAVFRVCADGGANRLHDEVPAMFPNEPAEQVRARFLPHLIKGDLDSVRPDVLEFYTRQGVAVKDLSHDQMSTDLQKCITFIESNLMASGSGRQDESEKESGVERNVDTVVALGAHGGRLDHILSNLSTLYTFRGVNIVLCGDGNLTRLIPAGKAVIRPYRPVEGPTCGLVPLMGPAVASTSGLRWNLSDTRMEIGGLVSTSNVLESDEIEVETDVDLIWTTELRDTLETKANGQV